jgi:hypothetical protein
MRVKQVFLGCLSIPLLFVVVALVIGVLALALGPPDHQPVDTVYEQPIDQAGESKLRSRRLPRWAETDFSSPDVLDVVIDLQEGEFQIEPTNVGEAILIDADYDEAMARLERSFSSDPEDGDRLFIEFDGRGMMQQLRHLIHSRDQHINNRVRIRLPASVPMELFIRARKGESKIDLSGLSLRLLIFEHAMGASEVYFDEPNPIPMEAADFRGKMGEFSVTGLGYTGARAMQFEAKMGDFRVDFRGPMPQEMIASVKVSMGSGHIRVPRDIRLDYDQRYVIFGDLSVQRRTDRRDAERPSPQKTLSLNTSIKLGDMHVR